METAASRLKRLGDHWREGVTDVLMKALQPCAAGQGEFNVSSFGFGGKYAETGEGTNGFDFGETIRGGSGAGDGWHGMSNGYSNHRSSSTG